MLPKGVIRLSADGRKELRRTWVRLFHRFEKARRKCRRSLSEKRVHALRLAGRHCLPILEVLRSLCPDDALWSMTYHGLRDLLKALGPLRDAQVRGLRLDAMKDGPRTIGLLIALTKKEEKVALPSTRMSIGLLGALPVKALKGKEGRALLGSPMLPKVINSVMAKRRERLNERWKAISARRPDSLHKARVALKRYRYLLIALEPCLASAQRKAMPRLEKVQSAIGKWHDAQLFHEWLKRSGQPGDELLIRLDQDRATRTRDTQGFLRKHRGLKF